jgi:uncharacterized repeat protein (TIGR01451 family)
MKMTRFLSILFIIPAAVLLLGLLFIRPLPLFSQNNSSGPTAVSPDLAEALAAAAPGDRLKVILYLHETADWERAAQSSQQPDRRRAAIVNQLQRTAQNSQQRLIQEIETLQAADEITAYRPFWIINAIAVEGSVRGINRLAAQPDVARVVPDAARPLITPPTAAEEMALMWQTAVTSAADGQPWGIDNIRAPQSWYGLGIDGQGVTVAIMDSGVDWQHPDLLPNYRGNLGGGSYNHSENWFDATNPTNTLPIDPLGHGTHVAGTAVGQNGIGVAPGARWIAAKIANEYGFIYDSYVHAAFEWFLAPANDPALAPDVINGSWSGPGYLTTFMDDIQVLEAAGIVTVFAAGNSGPDEGSIGAPASYANTIAAGAHDEFNELTWFSARGPSPLHPETAPQFTAPGARVYSALPGGAYGYYNGTSMAAPHTTGAVALLLQANPALSRPALTRVLTETAVPLITPAPNMESGWGRLDVYAAVSSQTAHGTLTGLVQEGGAPLPGIPLTITTPGGQDLPFVTDENGRYTAPLQAGTYQLTVNPFGYTAVQLNGLLVQNDLTTTQDIQLNRLPSGVADVLVVDDATSSPVAATIEALNTPLSAETQPDGTASLLLPGGTYTLRVSSLGYEIANTPVTIAPNQSESLTIRLTAAKKVLLVDSGGWYYQSYRSFYEESLTRLGYAHDVISIRDPYLLPAQEQINGYDVIIWSAPFDSPGYIFANNVITDFLGQGGEMLITGQNVGYFDGSGYTQIWWYRQLQGTFLGETAVTHTITGAANTPYAGLSLTLNGSDSAQNQTAVDVVRPRQDALTNESFFYPNQTAAALTAGACQPFRLSYLGFGLEGVSGSANRDAVLERTFTYFETPRVTTGMRWLPDAVDDLAPPGSVLTYTLRLQNLSESMTDTLNLQIDGAAWPVQLSAPALTLGSCEMALVTMTLSIPANLPRDMAHDFTITAVSQDDPTVQQALPVHHKTPGHILLVGDDRWYDQEAIYSAALSEAGFTFDVWKTRWNRTANGSPSQALLNAYNYIIWYTGYDWFQPITPAENENLSAYLRQGGRLFLSSQDFLWYNHETPLAAQDLGVYSYTESITPTLIYRGHDAIPPNLDEPRPLTYANFQNNGDGFIIAPDAAPFVWSERGMAAGVARSAAVENGVSRSIFFSFPFEKLPEADRAPLMNSIVGWLSDLGESAFTADQISSGVSQTRTFTITLQNHPQAALHQVFMTNTLPISLSLQPGTLTGGASYDAATRQVRWQGELAPGQAHTITYQVDVGGSLPAGARVDNELTISYPAHELGFKRVASLWIGSPDMSSSRLGAKTEVNGRLQTVAYTLLIQNDGVAAASQMSATLYLPASLNLLTDTVQSSAGGITLNDRIILWQGNVAAGGQATVTAVATRTMNVEDPGWITAVAYLDDQATTPIVRSVQVHLPTYKYYFPIVQK